MVHGICTLWQCLRTPTHLELLTTDLKYVHMYMYVNTETIGLTEAVLYRNLELSCLKACIHMLFKNMTKSEQNGPFPLHSVYIPFCKTKLSESFSKWGRFYGSIIIIPYHYALYICTYVHHACTYTYIYD